MHSLTLEIQAGEGKAGQAVLEHRMGSKVPSLPGKWHWAVQESRQSLASVLLPPCLTHGSSVCSQEQHPTSPVPGRGSWVPKICSAPWAVAVCLGSIQELLRPGWLQGRLQGSCTAGKGNDQQLKAMKGKKLLHKTKSHISEHAMPSKHPQSSQILALLVS